MSFDERVNEIFTSRSYCKDGFFAVLTNTKFSLYKAFVEKEEIQNPDEDEEDQENDDENNTNMPITVHINCTKP